jgi:chromosome segregation ATPase
VSLQHQEDVAALIEHAEALERETAALRGRLAVAEQTERTLRARLGEKDHETHELKTRLTMTGGTDREKAGTTNTKDGRFKASTADISDDDESRVASLKARLASSEAELERVRRASRERVESMEKEVELYFEMAEEMKRTMRGDGVC